ncbi:MAG: DNA repair protein RecO [Gammaproteobacteria bacterium]|nr:DNA repair protein RecO [Gammaproteobacteria bacterium]
MTNRQRVLLQRAYILHQRPYRDSSVLLEIFSEHYGRCALIAKGVKRPRSNLRGLLQPFQPLLLSWISKSELGILTGAEHYQQPALIKPKYLPSAFYLNELILYLLHRDDPHDDLFQCYHGAIAGLRCLSGNADEDLLWQAHLRQFEIVLLQSIGYGLILDHDVHAQSSIAASDYYDYWPERGPVKSLVDNSDFRGVQVSGATLNMLANPLLLREKSGHTDAATRSLFKEAKQLLRTVLDHHLGSRILHSRSLMINAQSSDYAPVKSPQVLNSD